MTRQPVEQIMRKYKEISGRPVPAIYSIIINIMPYLTDGFLKKKHDLLRGLKYLDFVCLQSKGNLTARKRWAQDASIMEPLQNSPNGPNSYNIYNVRFHHEDFFFLFVPELVNPWPIAFAIFPAPINPIFTDSLALHSPSILEINNIALFDDVTIFRTLTP